MPLKILHTCLNVSDLDSSIKFYTDALGLRFQRRREVKKNNAAIAFLTDEFGSGIELTKWYDKKVLAEGDNFDHIAFETLDLDSTIRNLREKGVDIAMEPFSLEGSSNRIAFIKDPDGNWLELIEGKRQ